MVDLAKIRKKARELKQKSMEEAAPRIDAEAPAARLELYKQKLAAAASASAIEEQSAPSEEAAREHELLIFTMGSETFGIDIGRVEEVVVSGSVTRVPNAPRGVAGIVSVRGTIVAVLDIRQALGTAEAGADSDPRLLIVKDRGGMAGFAVDRVSRVMKFDPRELEEPPSLGPGEQSEVIEGILRRDGRVVAVVSADRLLTHRAAG